jgi:hypothetical protein
MTAANLLVPAAQYANRSTLVFERVLLVFS